MDTGGRIGRARLAFGFASMAGILLPERAVRCIRASFPQIAFLVRVIFLEIAALVSPPIQSRLRVSSELVSQLCDGFGIERIEPFFPTRNL
jgi:hypothetical protein